MRTGALRQYENAADNKDGDYQRSQRPAEVQAALRNRLIEEIAHRRAKRSRQNERGPEQQHVRDPGPEIEGRNRSKRREKNERATAISEACVGGPIAECRAERL